MNLSIEGVDDRYSWVIREYVEDALLEHLEGPSVDHLRVQLLPPTSGGHRCRVTARLRDGRDVWCTAVDEQRRRAVDGAVNDLRASLHTMHRGRRIALLCVSAAVFAVAVALTAVLAIG
jgi:ribosome-associated translation inhibitor RaiA